MARTIRTSAGVDLAVHELGGQGPPLLIAHATGLCTLVYEKLAGALFDRFTVVGVDARGHGLSGRAPGDDQSWRHIAAELIEAVDDLGSGPVHAFGHSMGGAVLLLAEAVRPGLLRSAFLYEPIVFPAGVPGGQDLALGARSRRPSFESRADALWRYATGGPLSELRADALALYVTHGFREQPEFSVTLRCEPEVEARTFEGHRDASPDTVAGAAVPTVVATGRTDLPGPASLAPSLIETLPRAELVTFDHLTHFGPLQDPATIAEAVAGHARRVDAG